MSILNRKQNLINGDVLEGREHVTIIPHDIQLVETHLVDSAQSLSHARLVHAWQLVALFIQRKVSSGRIALVALRLETN